MLWLEEYLQRWKKTLVVVSHDREFLNNVCTDIIHLHDLKLTSYRGSFAQFEEMYEQRRREANKAFEKYEKQLKAAKATSSKAKIEKVQAGAKQKAEQQAAKKGGKHGGGGGSDEEGGAKGDAPRKWSDYTVSFAFPEPTELPPPLLSLSECCFKYPGREDFGLADVSCGLDMGSRVAIVGPNGAGKSTLLNLIAGDLDPTSGESRRSQKLRIGRYSQHFVDILAYDENPVEYLMRMHPTANLKPETARALLGRFGLEGHNHLTPIIKLSGGQKARVVFASICLSQPHMLLLDEVRGGCVCMRGWHPARSVCLLCWLRAHPLPSPLSFPRSPPTTWTCRASTRWATRWRSSRAAWCLSPTTHASCPPSARTRPSPGCGWWTTAPSPSTRATGSSSGRTWCPRSRTRWTKPEMCCWLCQYVNAYPARHESGLKLLLASAYTTVYRIIMYGAPRLIRCSAASAGPPCARCASTTRTRRP